MRNVRTTINDDILTIEVDLSAPVQLSKSGKSSVIASTEGNVSVKTDHGPITIGLNVYRKAE